MNRMARYQLFRNQENDDDVAAFRRLAMLHRQNARDANPRGNDLDFIRAVFHNAPGAVREARYERVTVNGSSLRYGSLLNFYYKCWQTAGVTVGQLFFCL